jgi:hypothetical protein
MRDDNKKQRFVAELVRVSAVAAQSSALDAPSFRNQAKTGSYDWAVKS